MGQDEAKDHGMVGGESSLAPLDRVVRRPPQQVTVEVSLDGVTDAGLAQIATLVDLYVRDLTREAGRLEAGARVNGLAAEVTASNISTADEVVRHPLVVDPGERSASKLARAVQLTATLSGVAAGVMATFFDKGVAQAIAFGALLVLTAITTSISVWRVKW